MKMSMYVKFQLFEQQRGVLVPLTIVDVPSLSLGGYTFIINGNAIPFDWDAFSGSEEDGIFEFETGYGWFNDFELPDYYDNEYQKLGLSREDITAEFLASVERIDEIHINFVNAADEEIDLGCNDDERYKINLLEIVITDMETKKEYKVKQSVLDEFNRGAV